MGSFYDPVLLVCSPFIDVGGSSVVEKVMMKAGAQIENERKPNAQPDLLLSISRGGVTKTAEGQASGEAQDDFSGIFVQVILIPYR